VILPAENRVLNEEWKCKTDTVRFQLNSWFFFTWASPSRIGAGPES